MKRARRGRNSRILQELAHREFHGCEICFGNQSFDFLCDVLDGLKLTPLERQRLDKHITCPRCEIELGALNKVAVYSDVEKKRERKYEEWHKKHARPFDKFLTYLTAYPSLGGLHPVGAQLADSIRRAKVTDLYPQTWYRGRLYKDQKSGALLEETTAQDYLWPPQTVDVQAKRWSNEGQAAMYMGDQAETVTVELLQDVLQKRDEEIEDEDLRKIWIGRIEVVTTIRVLNVRIPFTEDNKFQPTLLQGLIYTGALRQATDASDKSNPGYRVTQYIADLVRRRNWDGILYTSSQLYPFESEVWGTNLVLLQPNWEMLNVIDYCLYKSYRKPFESIFETGGLRLERIR